MRNATIREAARLLGYRGNAGGWIYNSRRGGAGIAHGWEAFVRIVRARKFNGWSAPIWRLAVDIERRAER